jgi:peptidoglycan LD-endopeptidase LytH
MKMIINFTMKNYIAIFTLFLLVACNGTTQLDRILGTASPYEKYRQNLTSANLENTAMVRDWMEAGEVVLRDSIMVDLPYQETGSFDRASPKAMLLRFNVREGQNITIDLSPISQPDAQFFMDVFEIRANGELNRKHFSEGGNTLSYSVRNSGVNAIRIQPELFRGGIYNLTITYSATLAFPLPEKTTRNIASFWGDGRDGGRRKHEGIDIFAPRGTPVVAVTSGRVSRVGENRLGGKVVNVSGGGYSYYYAHLDSQMVRSGQRVEIGDTLGLVGNTGNAITTAPHLHFGIYGGGRGAVDPFHFLNTAAELQALNLADSLNIGSYGRIKGNTANIRLAPSTKSDIVRTLTRNAVFEIEGKTKDWVRVSLPDNQKAFIFHNLIEPAESALGSQTITENAQLSERWGSPHTFDGALANEEAESIGHFEDQQLLRMSSGRYLWQLAP